MTFFSRLFLFTHVAYHLGKVYFQSLYGAWRLARLQAPIISIFGGGKFKESDYYVKQAYVLSRMFINEGISVLTGGGSGIMQGATCAAFPTAPHHGLSIGIGVTQLDPHKSPCLHEYLELDYFFARKWLLTRFSVAFVIFPGGFGTCDELFELLTLIQTKKGLRLPVVLVGVEYWQPLLAWLTDKTLQRGLIDPEDLHLFSLTDDLNEAFCMLRNKCALR